MPSPRVLNARELEILEILKAMHGEYGDDAKFTKAAVEHFAGDAIPGTLAFLMGYGMVVASKEAEGIAYRLTPLGVAALDHAASERVKIIVPPGADGRMN